MPPFCVASTKNRERTGNRKRHTARRQRCAVPKEKPAPAEAGRAKCALVEPPRGRCERGKDDEPMAGDYGLIMLAWQGSLWPGKHSDYKAVARPEQKRHLGRPRPLFLCVETAPRRARWARRWSDSPPVRVALHQVSGVKHGALAASPVA